MFPFKKENTNDVWTLTISLTFTDESYHFIRQTPSAFAHPHNIPEREKLEDMQMRAYRHLQENIAYAILSSGLILAREYGAADSYAYFFDFHARDGRHCRFQLELADHEEKSKLLRTVMPADGGHIVLKSVSIGPKHTFQSGVEAIYAIYDICHELYQGHSS